MLKRRWMTKARFGLPTLALLCLPLLTLLFYGQRAEAVYPLMPVAANTTFSVPAEARGNTYAGQTCASGCTGTAITIPSGRLGFVFVSASSGDIPRVLSAHGTWELLASRSGGENSSTTRRTALFAVISGTNTPSAVTLTMPNNAGDGGTVVYAYAASGYTYIRQVRLINYNDPTSEGGDNGTAASPATVNLLRTPIGPVIAFGQIVGTATSIQPDTGEPYSELCFGASSGELQGNGSATPTGSWCMADDTGDSSPSIAFTGGSPFHWSMIVAEVANSATTLLQAEVRGFSEFTGTTAATGAAVTTDAFYVYPNTALVAAVAVNDGVVGDNTNADPITVSDSTGKTWTEIRTGGQASGNADSRIDSWWAPFTAAASGVTVTFTPSGTGRQYAYVVTQFIGADLTAPIAESGGSNGTGTATVTLGSIATGNMAFSFTGLEVGTSVGQGTGDMEYSEAASSGTNPQRIQAQRCGSNVCDVAGLGGNQGTILAFEVALGSVTVPEQAAAPQATPQGSSSTNQALIAFAMLGTVLGVVLGIIRLQGLTTMAMIEIGVAVLILIILLSIVGGSAGTL